MKKFLFYILILLFPCLLHSEEEILVRLATESHLSPLYLDAIKDEGSGFNLSYLKELEKILEFDLNHNGMTKVTSKTKERIAQIAKENRFDGFDAASWKSMNIAYLVKLKATGQKLSAAFCNISSNNVKVMEDLPLTGNLSQDRRQLHAIADAMHQAFFAAKGICSTRVLYTIRTKIAEQNSEKWVTEVWEADYDGANSRQITREGHLCVTPTYIPSQKGLRPNYFFYVSYRIGQPKIFIASLKDGTAKRLSYLRGNQLMPAINQARTQIAFISDIDGNPDLFLQDFDGQQGLIGKPRQIFSAPKGTQGTPSFSPDGKRVAFVSNKDGTARIYLITIPSDGTSLQDIKPTLISKKNKDNTSPAWSPDGTKIAYSASTQGVRQIWVYDLGTGKEMQLTQGSGHKENPTWAPNSLHIMFNSSTNNASELFLVNLNQQEATKISKGPGEKRFPSWEPLML